MGALTMLNEAGDTTITWTEDRDDEVEAIIQKRMDEGCSFFIIDPRFGHRQKLKRASDAMKHRVLAIPDEDWRAFVGEGKGELVATPPTAAKTVRKARTAKEVAKNESVGIKPKRGG
jgi:hypothetical protein